MLMRLYWVMDGSDLDYSTAPIPARDVVGPRSSNPTTRSITVYNNTFRNKRPTADSVRE
jgi:hypothetical protein